ncbi:MAG: cell division FtsA domain-containing protein, partial [bacterium]
GGTSDIAIFSQGSICDTEVISIGGEHVTQDVMKGLRTTEEDAEMIKINNGCADGELVPEDEKIEVPDVGGRDPREIPRRELCEIIEPRMEEIFQIIDYQIKKSDFSQDIVAGMVVTGGAAGMQGIPDLAEDIL